MTTNPRGRKHGALEKDSLSSKILNYALKHPGYTSRDIATELNLAQNVVSTALIVHVKQGRLTRVGEKNCFRYWGPVSDKESTDGGVS
jgi:Winged helix-turn-helix DNA-binding